MAVLTADLIGRLRDENSPQTRRDTVVLVAAEFAGPDLTESGRELAEAWQQAVAARAIVTEPVSDALVDYGSGRVVNTLVHNPGAKIADDTTAKVIDNFANSEAVMGGLAERPSLPPALAMWMPCWPG